MLGKLVGLSKTPVRYSDEFHMDLIHSALARMGVRDMKQLNMNEAIERLTMAPTKSVTLRQWLSGDYALLTLFLIVFIDTYFPKKFQAILKNSQVDDGQCPVLILLKRLAVILVEFLVKRRLSKKLSKKEEVVEVVFFFYAGLTFKWFDLFADSNAVWKQSNSTTRKVVSFATSNVTEILSIANQYYSMQASKTP